MSDTSFTGPLIQPPIWIALAIIPVVIWELVWKGLALWRAAQNRHKYWFIALLLLNTIGILPIIYILMFRPRSAVKVQRS